MYALLKSKINGKPFLTIHINTLSDLDRVENFLVMMNLSAELHLQYPEISTVWTAEDVKNHLL